MEQRLVESHVACCSLIKITEAQTDIMEQVASSCSTGIVNIFLCIFDFNAILTLNICTVSLNFKNQLIT